MSLGGPRASSMNDAVEDLVANGIMVVVAAGNNNGGDACSYSPSSAPSVISVGATTSQDQIASFSNIGACLFTFAPGAAITSASYSSDTGEATMSGTSMAAPHVGGVVALVLQMQPGAAIADVKAALDRAAPKITFESSSPSRLLNAQSSRLRPPSTPTTNPPTTNTPTTNTPTTNPPSSPAPPPSSPTPTPTTGFSPVRAFCVPCCDQAVVGRWCYLRCLLATGRTVAPAALVSRGGSI